ncbi:MAG: AAA family ATPase [Gemmatimonadales bacterium]
MQIRRLRLLNFRQHADTTLDFDTGLTGIIGPNGAGKSTLLEAVAWAMYGTQAARGTRDSIRRRNAPPRSRVEVELEIAIGAHTYRMVRSLQTATLYQDGGPAPVANSGPAVTDKITRLLGMTRDEFFNTYFTGQKELAIMASMSAPERAKFLSRVLGYERLAMVQVNLRDERTGLRGALGVAESALGDLAELDREAEQVEARVGVAESALGTAGARRESADAVLASLAPEWEEAQRRRDEVAAIQTDLSIAEHAAVEAKRACEAIDRDLAEALAASAKREELAPRLAEWDALVARRDDLEQAASAFSERRALDAQAAEIRKLLAGQEARLGELPDQAQLEATRAELTVLQQSAHQAAHALEEQRTEWVREKQDAETMRKGLLNEYEEVAEQKERLEAAGAAGICPTCGKPLGAELAGVLDDLESRLADIRGDGKHYRARIEQLSREPDGVAAAKRALEQVEADLKRLTAGVGRMTEAVAERSRTEAVLVVQRQRLADLDARLAATPSSYDEAEHVKVRARVVELAPLRDEMMRIAARADRAPELVQKATAAEQHLSQLESAAVGLTEKLSALGWSAEAFAALKEAFQAGEREAQGAHLALVRAQAEHAAALEQRVAVSRRREERDRRLAEAERLRTELTMNQELDRAFTELRDDLNAALRPDLADAASTLLRDLTNGRYTDLELDEDYLATIVDDGEPKQVISGGEEDVTNLALRLAISQMIAERAGQPFSLLILDEVFGSLDEERRNAVMDLLRGLADRFPQVILITHIESVRENFDRIIRIDYNVETGVASAREEDPQRSGLSHAAA